MNNGITDDQRKRLIARLEKDLKESGESPKKERKTITLKKKKQQDGNNGKESNERSSNRNTGCIHC